MSNDRASICLFRLSALGDVTLMLPLVRTLQHHLPHCQLTWIIGRAFYPLVEGLPGVEFIVIDKPSSAKDYLKLKKRLTDYHFDVLFAMQASLRANLIYPFIHADLKIGFDKARSKDLHRFFIHRSIQPAKQHLLEGFLAFAEAIGIRQPVLRWDLPLSQSDYAFAKKHIPSSGLVIALNPAASKPERNWLVERYRQLIHKLQQRYQAHIVILGGPSAFEMKLADSLCGGDPEIINLAGKMSLKELAAVLSKVDLLISPDTGPLHIAGAVATPVVGLYAVAPPALSGPYLSQQYVVDAYPQAVETILKKNSQQLPFATRVHDKRAMACITVDAVLAKVEQCLAANQVVTC